MRFVETAVFTARATRLLSEESYRLLQLALTLRPDAGDVIPGSGGLRKLRWFAEGRGKRGGLRVIYHWRRTADACLMLYIYAKSQAKDLTAQQIRELRRLVAEELE